MRMKISDEYKYVAYDAVGWQLYRRKPRVFIMNRYGPRKIFMWVAGGRDKAADPGICISRAVSFFEENAVVMLSPLIENKGNGVFECVPPERWNGPWRTVLREQKRRVGGLATLMWLFSAAARDDKRDDGDVRCPETSCSSSKSSGAEAHTGPAAPTRSTRKVKRSASRKR